MCFPACPIPAGCLHASLSREMEDLKMMAFVQLRRQELVADERWGGLQVRQLCGSTSEKEGWKSISPRSQITTTVEIQSLFRVMIPDLSRPAPPQ